MAASDLLALVQKKTDSLDLIKPLRKYIEKQYGDATVKDYETPLNTLQGFRNEIKNLQDRNEASRDILFKYAATLSHVATHFPLSDGSGRIKLSFAWYDAFNKKKCSQTNVHYEQACALFNAAAITSQLGCAENRKTEEGCKIAAKHFQAAAGIFQHIKDEMSSKIVERISTDLTAECIDCLTNLMLANAQQCVYEKAERSKMKNATLVKLANEAAALYHLVATAINTTTLLDLFGRTWLSYVRFMSLLYEAKASWHSALDLHDNDKVGDEIARLEKTAGLLKESAAYARGVPTSAATQITDMQQNVERNRIRAEKENEKVYHERVPAVESLEILGRACLVKPTPFSLEEIFATIPDPFRSLIPIHVLEAKAKYLEALTQRIQQSFRGVREHRERFIAGLTVMGLPGSIMAAERKEGLPEEIHQKIYKIQQQGGLRRIEELLGALSEMSTETRKLSEDVDKTLRDEEEEDRQCREQFTARWARLPSAQLTVNLKRQLAEYSNKVTLASRSDTLINAKIAEHRAKLERCNSSRQELDAMMPHADLQAENDAGKSYSELKQLLQDWEKFRAKEEEIEVTCRRTQEQERVEQALINQQSNLEAAINQELSKYDAYFSELAALQQHEDQLMERIRTVNSVFTASVNQNETLTKRKAVIQDQYAAINKFDEIMANVTEGIQFYTTMQDLIRKLKQRADDFCFARKTEKQDIITNVQNAIAGIGAYPTGLPGMNPSTSGQQQQQQPAYNAPRYGPPTAGGPQTGTPIVYGMPPQVQGGPVGYNPYVPTYATHQQQQQPQQQQPQAAGPPQYQPQYQPYYGAPQPQPHPQYRPPQ